jgi:hypothetical protein
MDFTDSWLNLDNFPSTADADAVTSGPITVTTSCNAVRSTTCTGQCDTCMTQLATGVVDFECKYIADMLNHCADINDGQCTVIFGTSAGDQFNSISVSIACSLCCHF